MAKYGKKDRIANGFCLPTKKTFFSKFKKIRDIVEEEIAKYEGKTIGQEESDAAVVLKQLLLNELLKKKLTIPDYQRAYEWKTEHVKALLDDTYKAFQEEKPYFMGTVILHKEKEPESYNNKEAESYNIVDGQQRLITISILLYILTKKDTCHLLEETCYESEISKWYLRNTIKICKEFIERIVAEKAGGYYDYLQKILFSVIVLSGDNALEQAYTFFDGLNSKGKALSDYDLLKAHHLMFIPEKEESLAKMHNDNWQARDDKHKQLFETLLMRIRRWADNYDKDNAERYAVFNEFTSAVDLKNTSNVEHIFNRYMQPNLFRSWNRENNQIILNQKFTNHDLEDLIPMEIPQTIEGGDAFFLYAERYHKMYDSLFNLKEKDNVSTSIRYVSKLSEHIDNEQLRWAFEAIMLLYFDKFGEQQLVEVASCIELILAQARFTKADKTLGVRALSCAAVVKYVALRKLIPIICKSTISSHVYAQFIQKIYYQSFVPQGELSGVRSYYLSKIQTFYKKNKYLIRDSYLTKKIEQLYNICNGKN